MTCTCLPDESVQRRELPELSFPKASTLSNAIATPMVDEPSFSGLAAARIDDTISFPAFPFLSPFIYRKYLSLKLNNP